jgi:Fe-S-cluster containining protein
MSRPDSPLTAAESDAFLRSVENVHAAAFQHLSGTRDQASVVGFVVQLQRGIDAVYQERFRQGAKPDCQSGCSYCCHTRVEALPVEVFRIAQHLSQRAGTQLNEFKDRLKKQVSAADGALSWQDRPACIFLEDDRCSIYEIRPGVCRKAHSFDAMKCATGSADIPEDLGLLLDAEALMKGTSNAYEQLGFESAGVELGYAVLQTLSDPTLEARWYRGERVFSQKAGQSPESGRDEG